MSKIQDDLQKLNMYNFKMTPNEIVESYSVRDIKEYIGHLQKEISLKDKIIKELITDKAKLEVRLEIK